MTLQAGEMAPDFCLPTDLGADFKLSEQRGSWVVLYFYPKDDTSGCTVEAIEFTAAHEEFTALNIKILGVSCDNIEKHRKFKQNHNLTIELGSDGDKKVVDAYNVWVRKSMYGKTYFGIERSTFLINPDGCIAKIWRKVNVKEHVLDVLTYAKSVV